MSPVTGAIRDTSMLAAQMENLGFREKASSSDSQVCPVTKIVILKLLYFTFSLKLSSLMPFSARIFY